MQHVDDLWYVCVMGLSSSWKPNEPMVADIKCLSNVRRANAQPFCSCSRHIQCRTRSHCVILLNCFFLSIVSLSLSLSFPLSFSSFHRYKTLIRMTHAHWQANVPRNTWLIQARSRHSQTRCWLPLGFRFSFNNYQKTFVHRQVIQ